MELFSSGLPTQYPTPWDLDAASIKELDDYENQHPDGTLHRVLGRFSQGAELLGGFIDLIPNDPIPAKALIGLLVNIAKLAQDSHEASKSLVELARGIVAFMDQVLVIYRRTGQGAFTMEMWKCTDDIKRVIDKIMEWVFRQLKKGRWRRTFESGKIQENVNGLKMEFDSALQKFIALSQMNMAGAHNKILTAVHSQENAALHAHSELLSVIHSQEDSALLQEKLAKNADAKPLVQHISCLRDTRSAVLNRIRDWVADVSPTSKRLFWLTGNPGSGKSTIANTISEQLSEPLACQFFFSRTADPCELFKTLAFQLSHANGPASATICKALRHKANGYVCDRFNYFQVQQLFIEPLKAASQARREYPILVIIDALDEASSYQNDIRGWLATAIPTLHSNVKVLVTSRPERDIITTLESLHPTGLVEQYHVSTEGEEARRDIKAYIEWEMESTVESFNKVQKRKLPLDWPGTQRIVELCDQASGLFVWAATATSFIRKQLLLRGKQRIATVFDLLNTQGMTSIDELYHKVLELAFGDDGWEEADYATFRQVICALVALREPLNLGGLEKLLALEDEFDLVNLVGRLQSVLVLDNSETPDEDTIPRMHPSFVDFITNPDRCTDSRFRVERDSMNLHLAWRCLAELHTLRYNICKIPNFGTEFNSQISGLSDLCNRHIPKSLQYACRFWSLHLPPLVTAATDSKELLEAPNSRDSQTRLLFRTFFKTHLLHWMEATSLLSVSSSLRVLQTASEWAKENCSDDASLSTLISDAQKFVQVFSEPIRWSAAHVYISAIPFAPCLSGIYNQYQYVSGDIPTIKVVRGAPSAWTMYTLVLEGQSRFLNPVAGQPRVNKIASGCEFNTIQIWDAMTGHPIGTPLHGHSNVVTCVAWRIDGRFIVSGSRDCTVRIWDAETFKSLDFVLEGHTDDVTSVAFSPDGQLVASGSWDETVRLWNASSGQPIGSAVQGHTDFITSVAISPSGRYFSSGSGDKTVRVWDAASSTLIAVLTGHTDAVTSVAFSPDEMWIASGSSDKTVRRWSFHTGQPIGPPSIGHFTSIRSVEVSLDGQQIISRAIEGETLEFNAQTGVRISPDDSFSCDVVDGEAGALTITGGWVKRVEGGKIICWVPLERRRYMLGFRQGRLILRSEWWIQHVDPPDTVIIDVQKVLGDR